MALPKLRSAKSHSENMEKTGDEETKEAVPSINMRANTRRTRISNNKKVNTSDGMKLKRKTGFRQMSIKESFSNQETLSKRLRPRKVPTNYCENSVLQHSKKNSVNELNENKSSKVPVYKSVKLNEESLRNGSDIYDFKFDANDSKERLAVKRKGRLINRMRQKKVKRATRAKHKLVPSKPEEKVSSNIRSANIVKKDKDIKKPALRSSTNAKKSDGDVKKKRVLLPSTNVVKKIEVDTEKDHALVVSNKTSTESVPDNMQSSTNPKDIKMQPGVVKNTEIGQPQLTKVISENTEKQPGTIVKPRIVSIENLDNEKVLIDTPVKSNSKHVPFRKTNIFKNKASLQYGAMMNYSLINKSLSPIKKASENFDPGSPWRLSPLNTFSQVRTLFQSTPQPRQIEILQGRIKRNTSDQVKNLLGTVKKNDLLETDNENINTQKTLDKSNYVTRKFGQTIRKFGTEITNLDHSVQSINNVIASEQYEGTTNNTELKLLDDDVQNKINSVPNVSPSYSESVENKENAVPKTPKPKKLLRKKSKKLNNASFSSLHRDYRKKETHNIQSEAVNIQISSTGLLHGQPGEEEHSKENFEPQPGPSGLQKNKSSSDKLLLSPGLLHTQPEKEEQSKEFLDPQPGPSGLQKNKSPSNKPLQQTNLNAFLNIEEMPQSTRISTSHGIFNDAHSTPIYGKSPKLIKQVDTQRMDVDNAFGFEEDPSEGNLDISPIYIESRNNDVESKQIRKMNVLEARKSSELPVRLLPPTIKKNTVQENVDAPKDDAKIVDTEDIEVKQTLPVTTNKLINTVNFSDTFDILEGDNETKEEPVIVPLFKDVEPVHFTEPPKRSYKRKRNVKFSFSESGSEDNEELDDKEPQQKKKKYGKLKKTEVKRMKEWIKSINSTFQEIDKYELHVE